MVVSRASEAEHFHLYGQTTSLARKYRQEGEEAGGDAKRTQRTRLTGAETKERAAVRLVRCIHLSESATEDGRKEL